MRASTWAPWSEGVPLESQAPSPTTRMMPFQFQLPLTRSLPVTSSTPQPPVLPMSTSPSKTVTLGRFTPAVQVPKLAAGRATASLPGFPSVCGGVSAAENVWSANALMEFTMYCRPLVVARGPAEAVMSPVPVPLVPSVPVQLAVRIWLEQSLQGQVSGSQVVGSPGQPPVQPMAGPPSPGGAPGAWSCPWESRALLGPKFTGESQLVGMSAGAQPRFRPPAEPGPIRLTAAGKLKFTKGALTSYCTRRVAPVE